MLKNQKIILLTCFLFLNSFSVNSVLAQDTALDSQRNDCAKDSSMEWNPQLNRCITRVAAKAMRNEADACNKIEDINSRSQCHKALAEKNSGVQSDPSKAEKLQGNSLISMAYAALGVITMFGKSGKESTCTSKKIFGMTSLAGSVADIMMKIQAKKKMKKLEEQFQVDKKQNAYQSQVKALEYLREEQETVKDIAGKEKTRNMLMTAGFGAAALMAIYEMTPYSQNPDCYKKEVKDKTDATPTPTPTPTPVPATTATNADPTDADLEAADAAAGLDKDVKPLDNTAAAAAPASAPEKLTSAPVAEAPRPSDPVRRSVDINHSTTSGPKPERLSFKDGKSTYDIVDNKIYDRSIGMGKPVGTISYGLNGQSSTINLNGEVLNVGRVNSSSLGNVTLSGGTNSMVTNKRDWRSGGMKKIGK